MAPKLQQLRQDLQKPGLSDYENAQISAEIGDHTGCLSGLQRIATDPSVIRQPSTGDRDPRTPCGQCPGDFRAYECFAMKDGTAGFRSISTSQTR